MMGWGKTGERLHLLELGVLICATAAASSWIYHMGYDAGFLAGQVCAEHQAAEAERTNGVRYLHSSGGEEPDCPHWKCQMVFTEDDETAWECEVSEAGDDQ